MKSNKIVVWLLVLGDATFSLSIPKCLSTSMLYPLVAYYNGGQNQTLSSYEQFFQEYRYPDNEEEESLSLDEKDNQSRTVVSAFVDYTEPNFWYKYCYPENFKEDVSS